MILFFYGEDTYRMRQKLKALKEKFISASLGDTNLAVLDGERTTYSDIVRQILAIPFLSRKRLVIIENLLKSGVKETQEKIAGILNKVPDSTVLVFSERGVPDRRTVLFRKLNQPGRAEEFKSLEPLALRRFIKKEAASRSAEIDEAATEKLIQFCGNDLWRIHQELAKLIAYHPKISAETIGLLVEPEVKSNVFELIEATAAKKPGRAMAELYKLFHEGLNEIYILTMLIYQYRLLLLVTEALGKSPAPGKWELARQLKLNPYVAVKALTVAKKYQLGDLIKIYDKILDFESAIKTGKMEPRPALELLVFNLTKT